MNQQDFKALLDELKKLNTNISVLIKSIQIPKGFLGCGCKKRSCTCDPQIMYPPSMCVNCPGDFYSKGGEKK